MMLQLTVRWPKATIYISILHHCSFLLQNLNNISQLNPKSGGFQETLLERSLIWRRIGCKHSSSVCSGDFNRKDIVFLTFCIDMKSSLHAYVSAQPTKRFKSMTRKGELGGVPTEDSSCVVGSNGGTEEQENSVQWKFYELWTNYCARW